MPCCSQIHATRCGVSKNRKQTQNEMKTKTSGQKRASQPMTVEAAVRIVSATAKKHPGAIPPDSFAIRAVRAAIEPTIPTVGKP